MRIAVSIHFQRHGVGRLLVNNLLSKAEGRMSLEVTKDNDKAVGFYKRVGLRITEDYTTDAGVEFYKFSTF